MINRYMKILKITGHQGNENQNHECYTASYMLGWCLF